MGVTADRRRTNPASHPRRVGTGLASGFNGQHQTQSVAVIDGHDAVHAAVELWCTQAQPRIRFAGNFYSAEQFLEDYPMAATWSGGAVVLELEGQRNRVDFTALDRVVARRHRVIVYSHKATDEVILTSLDRGAVTFLATSEGKDHLIDAIRAAGTDQPYVGPRMAGAMLNDSTIGRPNLAPREKEVLVAWFRTERTQQPNVAGRRTLPSLEGRRVSCGNAGV